MSNALTIISGDIESVRDKFNAITGDQVTFEKEAGFAVQVLGGNEYALKVAMQNRNSVVAAVQNIAAIGISLNPALKQAYLVPRDGRICLDISYMGLMDLAMQSGSIRWAQCGLVYSGDDFALMGLDKQPVHKFNPFSKTRGDLVGVYCTVKTIDGDYLTHAMAIEDVFAIRDKSQAWMAFQSKKTRSCIWLDHEGEMVKKTCVKQAYKYWPKGEKSGKLENAIHYLNTQAGEGIAQESLPYGAGARPVDGAMESLSPEVQDHIREFALEANALFESHGVESVFDYIKAANMDETETIALWSLLPSDVRSALKKEGAARKEAMNATH